MSKPNIKTSSGKGTGEVPSKAQMDFFQHITGAVILVLFIGFISAIIAYYQFVVSANNQYNNSIREFNAVVSDYNNKRYTLLESQILILDNKLATMSGK